MRAPLLAALLAALVAAGCAGEKIDLTQGLQVLDVATGWHDMGIVDGQHKIVPVITFKLKNVSDTTLRSMQVNAVFRQAKEPPTEWGSGYMTVVKSEGLAPGATTNAIRLQSPRGYTGEEAPLVMMKNSNFVDGTVDLLAKYSSGQWQSIEKRPIDRTLLSQ
jgi:hypothetical protein